jgi:hypothetical protein
MRIKVLVNTDLPSSILAKLLTLILIRYYFLLKIST